MGVWLWILVESKVPVNRCWPIKKAWYRRVNTSFKETSSGVFASIQMNGDWCSIFRFFAHYMSFSCFSMPRHDKPDHECLDSCAIS
jgi:hypothetical protein